MFDIPTVHTIRLRVRGVVQGVGFRPFIYRLARRFELGGWVLNDAQGVLIQASGVAEVLEAFKRAIRDEAPPAARVEEVIVEGVFEVGRSPDEEGGAFVIAKSTRSGDISTLISPDLAVCRDCLAELFDPGDRRYHYPYITCTNCGPRYSIIEALPYDRPSTTMKAYPLCEECAREYRNPADRRFHAQPLACPECGPNYRYVSADGRSLARGEEGIARAATALRRGRIVAVKGLGGYHLACDAGDEAAVQTLRRRKYRKEKPFALMARDLGVIEKHIILKQAARKLLESPARPIVLLPKADRTLPSSLAPENADLGVMLPYTPLHHLLFAAGAPPLLVMTSANRSSEPIAYRDEEALEGLAGIADAFLVGERMIARRIDDSVVTLLAGEAVILRRARGYAPAPVLRSDRLEGPILALGAGLKNSITLVTGGYAFVSQHLGDLDNYDAFRAFEETVHDLGGMYGINLTRATVVHDLHPDYPSSRFAARLPGEHRAVQHHRAHIASVLAEHELWEKEVVGFAFDGAGLGEDGTIWGGEVFHGSLAGGLERVGSLRRALLPGGDAAARRPSQAAVGFLHELDERRWRSFLPEEVVRVAQGLVRSGFNTPITTSMGRLFDTVAALTGFTRKMTFEGQAAVALEALARSVPRENVGYLLPWNGTTWDYRPLLESILLDRRAGVEPAVIARRFHQAVAKGVVTAAAVLADEYACGSVVLSGGVWQNKLFHHLTVDGLRQAGLEVFWNRLVPAGDGGVSLGQAALTALQKEA